MISIDILPVEFLIAIFDFYANEDPHTSRRRQIEAWQSLVHVCRRWRSVVFGSPRRLNLRLYCSARTRVRDMLDVWPALPLFVSDDYLYIEDVDDDNVISALGRRDRVQQIILGHAPSLLLENVLEAMHGPFPELTELVFRGYHKTISDSFLGGSTPRLRSIILDSIPFPSLPKLLLSAPHLVKIYITSIPHSGFVSPEALLVALSTLTSLESLWLQFKSLQSFPDRASRHTPPSTRFVLSVLTSFRFEGVCDYLEDFVSRIDAPGLSNLNIHFLNYFTLVIDTSQFIQFISRTPKLKALDIARVTFGGQDVLVTLSSHTHGYGELEVEAPCTGLDEQVLTMKQIFTSSFPPFITLKDLYIFQMRLFFEPQPLRQDIENRLWLDLLHLFAAVKNLYVTVELTPSIVFALQELVGDRMTEALPTLQNIFLEGLQPSGPVQEGIGQFVTARKVTGHPISVSRWDRDL